MTGAGDGVLPRFSDDAAVLWRWVAAPQDAAVGEFVTRYTGLDDADRRRERAGLAADDLFTLVLFAQRCALSAVRDEDPGAARAAFDALSAIDLERAADERDVYAAAALAGYAAARVGLDPAEVAASAAGRAEPAVGEALIGITEEPVELVADWGYREVETSAGRAFFADDGEPYEPAADLAGVAVRVAEVLVGGGYRVADLTVATELPEVWLGGEPVENLTGCVSVHADALAGDSGQFLVVFLAEATTAEDAAAIARLARTQAPPDTAQLGLSVGKVCAVVVAAAGLRGAPPPEDSESLACFEPAISELLNS